MLQLGPVLQFLGCQNHTWGIGVLVVSDAGDPPPALQVPAPTQVVAPVQMAVPGLSATAWRFDVDMRAITQSFNHLHWITFADGRTNMKLNHFGIRGGRDREGTFIFFTHHNTQVLSRLKLQGGIRL